MSNSAHRFALVVATKDRPDDVRRMLSSLLQQTRQVDQVVLVDGGTQTVEGVAAEFPGLNICYRRHQPPSAAKQRNVGVRCVPDAMELIGFLDDDATLEPTAVEHMLDFWRSAPPDVGGASFNLMNPTIAGGRRLKRSWLSEILGLYRAAAGKVAPSGWHSVMDTVSETCFADWLPTTAAVWRREVFEHFALDEYFDGYSYLEDLDFSYSVGRHYRLAVVADAQYFHYPSPASRISRYRFGRMEVANRLYFVRKHHLSVSRCYLGILIRLLLTLGTCVGGGEVAPWQRARGNLVEIFASLTRRTSTARHDGIPSNPTQVG